MKKIVLIAALTALSATSASALEAHYTKATEASASDAWAAVGDFCGISNWHPAVEKCEMSEKDGATLRTLHLKGGGTILEKLVEKNDADMSLTYTIVEGVLPVDNYKSTLKVVQNDTGATYDWSGSFDAKGTSDEEAVKTINGVYAAGVDSLVEKAGK